jgi:hypothetical protein
MLTEADAVYSDNHTKIKYKVCGQSSDIFITNAGDIHKSSQQCELPVQNGQKNTLLAHEMFIQYLKTTIKII